MLLAETYLVIVSIKQFQNPGLIHKSTTTITAPNKRIVMPLESRNEDNPIEIETDSKSSEEHVPQNDSNTDSGETKSE